MTKNRMKVYKISGNEIFYKKEHAENLIRAFYNVYPKSKKKMKIKKHTIYMIKVS